MSSSSDIELPVLTSHARSFQPPPERLPSSSPISETNSENRTANSIATMVDGVGPPMPAYSSPLNDIPPIPSSDAGLLEYTRLHGQLGIPLSSRQREDDRTPVCAREASSAEALPVYRADYPPGYSQSRHDSGDPMTWAEISFRIGFRTFFRQINEISVNLLALFASSAVFPLFWLIGALTLITPRGSIERIFMTWFKDFAPSADAWYNTLQTEAEKEAYLARMRVAEIRWAKRCLFAFSLLLCLVIVVAVTVFVINRMHWQKYKNLCNQKLLIFVYMPLAVFLLQLSSV